MGIMCSVRVPVVVLAVSSDVSSVAEYSKAGAKAHSLKLEQNKDGLPRIRTASARLGGKSSNVLCLKRQPIFSTYICALIAPCLSLVCLLQVTLTEVIYFTIMVMLRYSQI